MIQCVSSYTAAGQPVTGASPPEIPGASAEAFRAILAAQQEAGSGTPGKGGGAKGACPAAGVTVSPEAPAAAIPVLARGTLPVAPRSAAGAGKAASAGPAAGGAVAYPGSVSRGAVLVASLPVEGPATGAAPGGSPGRVQYLATGAEVVLTGCPGPGSEEPATGAGEGSTAADGAGAAMLVPPPGGMMAALPATPVAKGEGHPALGSEAISPGAATRAYPAAAGLEAPALTWFQAKAAGEPKVPGTTPTRDLVAPPASGQEGLPLHAEATGGPQPAGYTTTAPRPASLPGQPAPATPAPVTRPPVADPAPPPAAGLAASATSPGLPDTSTSPSGGRGSLDLAKVEPELTAVALPEEAGPPGAAPLPQELAPLLTGRPEGPVEAGANRHELAPNSQLREAVFQQVVHAGRLAKSRGRDTVVLRLTPPELGEVTLRLIHGPEGVTARFVAGLPEARAIIEGNLPRLEQALAGQGLQLQQAGVYADGRQSPAPRPRVVPARIRGFKLEVQPAYAVSLAATGLDMTM